MPPGKKGAEKDSIEAVDPIDMLYAGGKFQFTYIVISLEKPHKQILLTCL